MKSKKTISRILGLAFLLVLAASMLAFILPQSLLSGSISDTFVNISENIMLIRISVLIELVTSTGIVVLAVMLFTVFREQNKIIARIAFGWWLAEAIILAVSKLGVSALIPLSLEYVQSAALDGPRLHTLGSLFLGFDRVGYDIHMLFFCLGGILWYTLFFKSKYIPKALSLWGIAAVSLALVGTVFGFLDIPKPILLVIPNALFELTIGLWLIIKGFDSESI
jgi:hypothetical protein